MCLGCCSIGGVNGGVEKYNGPASYTPNFPRSSLGRARCNHGRHRVMSLPPRLDKLSHAQLLQFAVDACESSPELKNKADALIAEVAPLPSWCVDVLLSPDLLPQLFSSLGISEHAAAGACTAWHHAYSRQLRRRGFVIPRSEQELPDVTDMETAGLCMLPGGVLAIASCDVNHRGVRFVAARNDTDPQALAACRASSLAARLFGQPSGLAHTNDGLLVCSNDSLHDPAAILYKFAQDGSMDLLATVPVLADYDLGISRCAVHQQTQRTYAIVNEAEAGRSAVVLFDSDLQVVATVEATVEVIPEGASTHIFGARGPITDLAVHGDQVIVLTSNNHDKGSGLRLIDLDGRFLRTIAAGQFQNPQAVTASHGRAFVIDKPHPCFRDVALEMVSLEGSSVLYIIDIQSGDIIQRVVVDLEGETSGILVDGDEIYIAECGSWEDASPARVVVLQLAGSEA